MSKVQSVNYQNKSNLRQKNYASRQSFGKGNLNLPKDIEESIIDGVKTKVNKRMGLFGFINQKLADSKGEIQTQSINAIFTSTLAPLMIAFNPFSKADKKTKEYTAWRQPISAGIAISGGLAMTISINNYLNTIYNEGYNQAIDLRPEPSNEYLKRIFKYKSDSNKSMMEHLKDNIKKIKEQGFVSYICSNESPKTKKLNDYVKNIQDQRIEFFTDLLTADPKNIRIDEKTKEIFIGNKALQKEQIIKVPNLETRKQLEEYLEANSLYKLKLSDFLKNKFGFEFYEKGDLKGQFKPHIISSKLSELKAMDFLYEIGLIEEGKVNENELRRTLAVHFQERNRKQLEEEVFNKKVLKEGGIEKLQEFMGKLSSRITQMTVGEEIGKAKAVSLGQFFHQLGYYTSKDKNSDKTLQELMDKPMAKVLKEFEEIFKGKLVGFGEKTNLEYFAKNIIKKKAKDLAKNAGNHKFFIGIFLNLFTTAITCTILNWAYPRIVEKLFPHLVESDKPSENKKGGTK